VDYVTRVPRCEDFLSICNDTVLVKHRADPFHIQRSNNGFNPGSEKFVCAELASDALEIGVLREFAV
jgi:hypothetical protein